MSKTVEKAETAIAISNTAIGQALQLSDVQLYNAISNPEYRVKELVNTEFFLIDTMLLPERTSINEETGEVEGYIPEILFITSTPDMTDPKTVLSYSITLRSSIANMRAAIGLNRMVKLTHETDRNQNTIYKLLAI